MDNHVIGGRGLVVHFIPISYCISYIGCYATLECLSRRTALGGLYNWRLLAAAAFSMGSIAIWGTHFIIDRAIILGDGFGSSPFVYSYCVTVLSLFGPMAILAFAFCVLGEPRANVDVLRLVLGGTLSGLGVCIAQYLGDAAISNYECTYTFQHIIGAILVTVITGPASFFIFFRLQNPCQSDWRIKTGCSGILAAAISGTHWLASAGTWYVEIKTDPSGLGLSQNDAVAGAIILAALGCLALLLFKLFVRYCFVRYQRTADQIAVAAVVFDRNGNILVGPDGLIPCRKLTNKFLEKSVDDVFNVAHPLYSWIFRTTRHWPGVSRLIPGMQNHVDQIGVMDRLGSHDTRLLNDQGDPIEGYSFVFRELFCLAAAALADEMEIPLEHAGVLFDTIITTGQSPHGHSQKQRKNTNARISSSQSELGKGQLLFLIRSLNSEESIQMRHIGFRFSQPQTTVSSLSRAFQIRDKDLLMCLESALDFANSPRSLDHGVHLACFAIRASLAIDRRGFEVLVRRDARGLLPTMLLPLEKIKWWHLEYLRRIDDQTVGGCMEHFKKSINSSKLLSEQTFAKQLLTTLEALSEQIHDPFFNDARLIAKPVNSTCRKRGPDDPGMAELIVFKFIIPIQAKLGEALLEFVPLGFLKMQQYVHKNSTDHVELARKTRTEFEQAKQVRLEDETKGQDQHSRRRKMLSRNYESKTERKTERQTYVDELFALCLTNRGL